MSLQAEGGFRDFLVMVRLLVFFIHLYQCYEHILLKWCSQDKNTANIFLVKKCQSSILQLLKDGYGAISCCFFIEDCNKYCFETLKHASYLMVHFKYFSVSIFLAYFSWYFIPNWTTVKFCYQFVITVTKFAIF